jgi:hypothetical protein
MKILRVAVLCIALIGMTSPAVFAEAVRVHGTVQSVGPARTLVLMADDGRTLTIDFTRDDIDARLLKVGEKITVFGESGGQAGPLRAHNIVQDETRQMHRVHGTISSVGPGRRLVLKADDGRTLSVDFSRDDIDIRHLTVGEKITVTGVTGRELNVFTAHNLSQDEARTVQRLHGTIQSLGPGRRLVLRTDDGRTVNVDFSREDIDLRLLTVGEKVTVAGVTGRELNVFTAHNVIQD